MRDDARAINWFESTWRSIGAQLPDLKPSAVWMTRRLAALMLERLPTDIACEILGFLPESAHDESRRLEPSATSDPDRSIGYPQFVERAGSSVGRELPDEVMEKAADAFLWAFAQDFPSETKQALMEQLPAELRNRMALRSADSESAKVA